MAAHSPVQSTATPPASTVSNSSHSQHRHKLTASTGSLASLSSAHTAPERPASITGASALNPVPAPALSSTGPPVASPVVSIDVNCAAAVSSQSPYSGGISPPILSPTNGGRFGYKVSDFQLVKTLGMNCVFIFIVACLDTRLDAVFTLHQYHALVLYGHNCLEKHHFMKHSHWRFSL